MTPVDVLTMLGEGTTYDVTHALLGRDRSHPESGEDWEFIATQDWVRMELAGAFRAGIVARVSIGRLTPRWLYFTGKGLGPMLGFQRPQNYQ